METRPGDGGSRFLIIAASLVIVIAGMKAAASVILPFLIAVFVAMISLPLQNWLMARRVPAGLAVLATLTFDIAVLVGLGFLVGNSIQAFTEEAPKYQAKLTALSGQLIDWLNGLGIEVSRDAVTDLLNPGMAFDVVAKTLGRLAALVSNFVLVALTIVFVLLEAAGFPAKLERAFGKRARSSERFEKIKKDVHQYLAVKTAVSLATGVIVTVPLWLMGIDFPILWGLLAFLLNYVPSLGSIIAAVPPVLLAIVQFGPGRAAGVAAVFVATNVLLGNFVEPQLTGRRLGLSTLVVFVSLVFWGWVWGPIGMLLSVPLTMIVKIMLENTQDLRWVAILLGPGGEQQARPDTGSTRKRKKA
jgi:predicted PurR-regulated permease PerM